ncbi:hypothetical protein [Marinoscillum sp.]|uniref:hypothetical protein n=1 Tax=Marinoscillum sp. TaxID=2024838 RepID=UPI003BAC0F06
MYRLRLFTFLLTIAAFLMVDPVSAQLPFGKKKDDTEESKDSEEEGDEKDGFGGKFKAKMKNFNPMKSIGKLAGNLLTSTTDDLNTLSMQVLYMQNLYPSETMTVETEYFGFWEAGMDMTGVLFLKKEGVGMSKIDGSVKIDGNDIEHVANGFYGGIVEKNSGSHSVDIQTVSGDMAKLTADPIEPIEIVSINGVPRGEVASVNMDEDLVLELKHPQGGTDDFYVAILGKVMGIRGFNEIGFFKSVDKITIPKEAFKHTATTAYKFEQGDNYLLVQRTKEKVVNLPDVGAAQVITGAMDWSPITLEGDQKTFLGVGVDEYNAKYETKTDDKFTVQANKPNAFWGPPLSQPKKLAMASFVVRATELKQQHVETSTSTSISGNVKTTTTTTTTETRQFPEVPEVFWDQLVNEFYAKFEKAFLAEMNVELVPIEQTMKASQYANLFATEDTVSEEVVVKPYKGCKLLLPTTLSEMWSSRTSTFPNDKPEVKLMKELGVDGIISVTVDCAMAWEDGALSPRMSFRIDGPTNGWKVGPTTYANGLITGPGKGVSEAYADSEDIVDQLNQVMSVDRVIELFQEAMVNLKADEQGKGYEKIWALK